MKTSGIISVNYEKSEPTVSARELHKGLEVSERFQSWFGRQLKFGFVENEDFVGCKEFNTLAKQELQDYQISIEMAKQICMIQRSDKGTKYRKYFIELEKAWNSPEQMMARALKMADSTIKNLESKNQLLLEENERMKPKEIFADAVTASDTSILMRELAKILRQNGCEIGEKRLWAWMRENGYILKNSTEPSQRAMEQGLFERIERTIQRGDKPPMVTSTTKLTGKAQQFFINKFLRVKEGS